MLVFAELGLLLGGLVEAGLPERTVTNEPTGRGFGFSISLGALSRMEEKEVACACFAMVS